MDKSIINCLIMSVVLLGVDCFVQMNVKFTKVKKLVLHLILWGSILSPTSYIFMMLAYYQEMQILSIVIGCSGIVLGLSLIISSIIVKKHFQKKFNFQPLTELIIIAGQLYVLINKAYDEKTSDEDSLIARTNSIQNYVEIVKNLTAKYMISSENFNKAETELAKNEIMFLYNRLKSEGIEVKEDTITNIEKIFEIY